MSTRSNPFEELERFFERMGRQFEESADAWESGGPLSRFRSGFEEMAVDVLDHDEEFLVTVDLPGFERSDVEIAVTDHTLRIRADREQSAEESDEQYLRRERHHESMHRSIRLPDEVDKESVHARMQHGVLTVTLPKLDVEETRTVEIQ